IHDDQGMGHRQSCLPGCGNGFEQRSAARQDIVDDQRTIIDSDCAFNQFAQPVILRLLAYDERSPVSFRAVRISVISNRRGNGNGADLKATQTIDSGAGQRLMCELTDQPAGRRVGHQRPTIDIEWARVSGGEGKSLLSVPFKRSSIVKCLRKFLLNRHNLSSRLSKTPALYTTVQLPV